jgi:hypothetical protein
LNNWRGADSNKIAKKLAKVQNKVVDKVFGKDEALEVIPDKISEEDLQSEIQDLEQA